MMAVTIGEMGDPGSIGKPWEFGGSIAETIENEVNALLDAEGRPRLPTDDNLRETRDRRILFVAVARGIVMHLAELLGKMPPADLIVRNSATVPASNVSVTAGGLVLLNGTQACVLDDVNLTADIAQSGVANGLDRGAEAANTWYFIYVIFDPRRNTIATLLSTSATSPLMPSGYTFKRRVGAVRNDGSSNFLRFVQRGRTVLFAEPGDSALDAPTASFRALSLAKVVPTTARRAIVNFQWAGRHSTSRTISLSCRPTGTSFATGVLILSCHVTAGQVQTANSTVLVETDTAQSIDYRVSTVPNIAQAFSVFVNGYEDTI